eukprot:scaffold978_cov392-Prasinococcus_capsulatus_cf.AAC.17
MRKEDIANSFIHLTNVAIQRTAENYDAKRGMKWPIRNLKLYLTSKHGCDAIDKLFHEIEMVIIRSLQSVQNVIINDKHCFELYGYDVMIDEALRPWLIEVNASPSLTADTEADYSLKRGLLDDTLTVLDMEGRRASTETPEAVGGFDLLCNGGGAPSSTPGGPPARRCTLGYHVPRQRAPAPPHLASAR